MKKLFVLVALLTTVYVSNSFAQDKPASDPAATTDKIKEKLKPQLMEKAHLTDAEASRVLTIYFAYSTRLASLKNAPVEEQKKQAAVIQEARVKEYSAIPLNEEKIKAVNLFFEDQQKQAEKRRLESAKTNN